MLPTYFSPCPAQTQSHHVYRAWHSSIYIQAKHHVYPPSPDPSSNFIVVSDGIATHPQMTRSIQLDQLQLRNWFWAGTSLTYVYYYGGYPPILLGDWSFLLPAWWHTPQFEYGYQRPMMPVYLRQVGAHVYADVDRHIVSGSTVLLEWRVYISGVPTVPFIVTFSGTEIDLYHPWFAWGPCTRVTYTKGSTPFAAADRGELQSFDLDYPYP